MIGGADLVLEGPTRGDDADFLVRSIRSLWPDALIQDVSQESAESIRRFKFPVTTPTELLVYRDEESWVSWETKGATEENQDAMLHVIVSPRSVTVVVDRSASPLADIVREFLDALRYNRVVLPMAA